MRRPLTWFSVIFLLTATQVFAGQFERGIYAAQQGDYAKARKLWVPLAKHGNVKAEYNLGLLYHQGLGVRKNDHFAVKWWRKAAAQGDAMAQTNLGNMYNFGLGVPLNYKEAAKWYQYAANKGNETAQYNIGFMYLKGNGKPRNYHKAMYWFRRAANRGDAYARFYIGFMYEHGQGVGANPIVAYALYNLIANQSQQQNNLAAIYRSRLANRISQRSITRAEVLTQKLLRSKPMTKALDTYLTNGPQHYSEAQRKNRRKD